MRPRLTSWMLTPWLPTAVLLWALWAPAVQATSTAGRLSFDPVAEAARIDALLASELAAQGLTPAPLVDDATFIRRAFLTLAGRIPQAKDVKAFLEDTSDDKRHRLVDRLIGSPAYHSHQFTWWADLLRLQTRLPGGMSGEPYAIWLREAISENRPYDEMVRELLTATGSLWERGNGATGYVLRDRGMPQDNMAGTAQIFLGTSIACAQCHDHPTQDWTRRQFMEMTAFTAGAFNNRYSKQFLQEMKQRVSSESLPQSIQQQLRRLGRAASQGVAPTGNGSMPLPADYQYDDANPRERIRAKPLFGSSVRLGKGVNPREAFAGWLTSPDNPRFTQVVANRQFKKLFGVGLIEPADDLDVAGAGRHPALMGALTNLMTTLDYDLEAFQRVLCRTRLFQQEADICPPGEESRFAFRGPALRRLSAEQIWDSLVTLVVDDPEMHRAEPVEPLYVNWEKIREVPGKTLVAIAQINVEGRQQARQFGSQMKALGKELKEARVSGDRKVVKSLNDKMKTLRKNRTRAQEDQEEALRQQGLVIPRRNRATEQVRRASELEAPARPGHFLREFGQSDREVIDNASRDGSITQALTLMNGFIDTRLISPEARLTREVTAARGAEAQVETVFLNILARGPTRDERGRFVPGIREEGGTALMDLAWVLLNSNEFIFWK